MSDIKSFIKQIMQDIDGQYSFKRMSVLVCLILLAVGFIGDQFFKLHITESIYNSVTYIVMTGLGVVGAEKFAPKRGGDQ